MHRLVAVRAIAFITLLMVPALAGTDVATAQMPSTPVALITDDTRSCVDGRLRIRDLAGADEHLSEGLQTVEERARMWQEDARLIELRLSCPLLKVGLQWEGTFFSETAQATYSTDTGAIEPSELAPAEVPFLDVSAVSFQVVHRSLLRAGFSDELKLAAASSMTVRLGSENATFGPPTAPTGAVYVHVAVEERGVIKDVWIDAQDGTIYRYDLEG